MSDDLIRRQDAIELLHNCNYDLHRLEEWILDTPAIDAEPIRHGRWEMKPDPYGFFDKIPVCSLCGCTPKYREKSAFCPHCGGKNDGGEGDAT